jgi:hypothetical protein
VLAETGVTHDPAVPSRVDRTRPTERNPHEQP